MPIFDLLLCLALFPVDVTAVRPGSVQVTTTPQTLVVRWPDERQRQWTVEFSRDPERSLIARIGLGTAVVERMKPLYWIEAGKRRGGFDQFFDFPPSHAEGRPDLFCSIPAEINFYDNSNILLDKRVFRQIHAVTFYPN